ncbi:uroporphyrinogen-III synthase [Cognatiyoonia koreensis]|nr:uroporphyrinogen-III synthase [Cognatiyoonia koreensis]
MPAKLIITRPSSSGKDFARKVNSQLGYDVPAVLAPGLAIRECDPKIPDGIQHVIFTSVHGVAQARRLRVPTTAHAWCVGEKTRRAADEIGFESTVGGGDAQQLLQTILNAKPVGLIAHIAGRHTRGDIAYVLQCAGLTAVEVTAYDQVVLPAPEELIAALHGNIPLVAPLFSARSGLILTATEWHPPVHVIAISRQVADFVTDWGADTVQIAEMPNEMAMLDATCRTVDWLKDGMSVT